MKVCPLQVQRVQGNWPELARIQVVECAWRKADSTKSVHLTFTTPKSQRASRHSHSVCPVEESFSHSLTCLRDFSLSPRIFSLLSCPVTLIKWKQLQKTPTTTSTLVAMSQPPIVLCSLISMAHSFSASRLITSTLPSLSPSLITHALLLWTIPIGI